MILTAIRLHPFAGTPDRSVAFAPGLNVVLGPNEVGKSTLVRALSAVLFCKVDMTPAVFRNTMQRHMPAGSGDTIRVSLRITRDGGVYSLEKSWGGTRSARLCLPDGSEITDPREVEEKLRDVLEISQGTFENVLLAYQSRLGEAIEALRASTDVKASLADLLRRSLFKADGVSVERLQQAVDRKVEQYCARWDRAARRPEGGRDFDRPWEKGHGIVVKAYYELRTREEELAHAERYEVRIDEFARQIAAAEHAVDDLDGFVRRHAALVDDLRTRTGLQHDLGAVQRELRELKDAQTRWPRCEVEIAHLESAVAGLRTRYRVLREEQRAAQEYEQQRALRERLIQARRLQDEVSAAEERLAQALPVSESDMKALADVEKEISGLRAKRDAQALAIRVAARAPLRASFQSGASPARPIDLRAGEEFTVSADGSASIDHADWSISVHPAGGGLRVLEEEQQRMVERRQSLLGALGTSSLEEAQERQRAYELQKHELDSRRRALLAVTGEEGYTALVTKAGQLPGAAQGRSLDAISDDLDAVGTEGNEKAGQLKKLQDDCDLWKEKFGDQEALWSRIGTWLTQEQDLLRRISALRPLPPDMTDPEAFLAHYERVRKELDVRTSALFSLRLDRKEFEKQEPPASTQDLRDLVATARQGFDEATRHAEAYLRIQHELRMLLGELDRHTFQPLQQRFEALVSALTENKYTGLEMTETLPQSIRSAERVLPLDLLSVGTLDVLALAMRLGMAAYYLEGKDGFVVMDDPLVNLDPVRQRLAARTVAEFAAQKQTIILTCHPAHAEILGGSLVEMA